MIRAAAPGKVVLWGEYAVLAGAPALVMAVNRYARCSIEPGGSAWDFSALGHQAAPERVTRQTLLGDPAPAGASIRHLVRQALEVLAPPDVPEGARVVLDTADLHDPAGLKLGLGSSAALTVTICGAFGRLLGQPVTYRTTLDVHRRFQNGSGSGLDVAAAWHGGLVKFRRGGDDGISPWRLPGELRTAFVFTGASAATTGHLARLEQWRERGGTGVLDELAEAATDLFETDHLLDTLPGYVAALRALDDAAGLGIFGAAHQRLTQLAIDAGVVYKPCGAGGGDIGAAFTADPAAAERFTRLALDNGFPPLALETASHGIEVTG